MGVMTLVAGTVLLVLAACGNDADDVGSTSTSTVPITTTTTRPAPGSTTSTAVPTTSTGRQATPTTTIFAPSIKADLVELYDFAGPPDKGSLGLRLDPAKPEVCYELRVRETDPVTSAHIHRRSARGALVLTLNPGTLRGGQTRGQPGDGRGGYAIAIRCQPADLDLVGELIADPAAFYVDIHTDTAPNGAVGGPLGPA